jgi:hypothetical protein
LTARRLASFTSRAQRRQKSFFHFLFDIVVRQQLPALRVRIT